MQILPTLVVMLNKSLHGSDFDHCGVIVKDKFGVPYVYELTPFGAKLRLYSARILHSQARQILVIPMIPRIKVDESKIDVLIKQMAEESKHSSTSSFAFQWVAGLFSFYIGSMLGTEMLTQAYSPECKFVGNTLQRIFEDKIGEVNVPRGHTVTCKTLFDDINKFSNYEELYWIR
jgi:hypothetical protein